MSQTGKRVEGVKAMRRGMSQWGEKANAGMSWGGEWADGAKKSKWKWAKNFDCRGAIGHGEYAMEKAPCREKRCRGNKPFKKAGTPQPLSAMNSPTLLPVTDQMCTCQQVYTTDLCTPQLALYTHVSVCKLLTYIWTTWHCTCSYKWERAVLAQW